MQLIYSATASIMQPIFAKGLNRAQLKIAKAQYAEALLAFQQILLHAGNEVNNTLLALDLAQAKIKLRQEQVVALERAVESATLLMQYGQANYLEVLTAQQALLDAQLQQSADWFAESQSIVSLYRALGGGQE